MNHHGTSRSHSPTLLVVSQSRAKLTVESSPILDSFNLVHLPVIDAAIILSWVQQYQPDLIVIDLEWSQTVDLQLTTALRLDWLTRNIPIIVIANTDSHKLSSITELDCDICLNKPYPDSKLEQVICTLVSHPACNSCGVAV